MTSQEVVTEIITQFTGLMQFMLPVIGVMAGIIFIITFLVAITLGLGKRTFGS